MIKKVLYLDMNRLFVWC